MKYLPTFIILISTFLSSCHQTEKGRQEVLTRPVRVVQIEALGTIDKSYTGIVEAEEFSILAFKVAGPLIALNVQQGQKIRKGFVIARIDPLDYQLKYNAADAYYQTAKSIYERNERLLAQNATAVQNVEIARADYIQAGSAVNIAESTLGYTHLTAPFDGLAEEKYVENFQKVLVGEPIVKLVNPNSINIRFVLPETSIGLMATPKTIYVEFDTYRNKKFRAEIKEYIYSSDGLGIPVTLRITDPDFEPFRREVYPGFSCKVFFKIENTVADKFIIPASALFKEGEQEEVWVVNPQTLTIYRQQVKTIRFDNQALVKEGLDSEDIIVTAGVNGLREGQKVILAPFQ